MNTSLLYQFINHLDEPYRFVTLTVDEAAIVMMGLMLLSLSSHKFASLGMCALPFSVLKQLKQGKGPKYLWVLAYWHLPRFTTGWLLRALPPSHQRVWRV